MAFSRRPLDLLLFGALCLMGAFVVRGWMKESDRGKESPTGQNRGTPGPAAPLPRLRPAPAPEEAPVEGAVSLLEHLDLAKDGLGSPWSLEGGRLISPIGKWVRLQVPCIPPEEYDLHLTVTRLEKDEAVILGLVFQGRQCQIVLDGNGGHGCWMEVKDGGHGITENGVTYFDGGVFAKNRPADVRAAVRKTRLTVTVDGFTVLDWIGRKERLYLGENWDVPDKRVLFLGLWESVFVFDHLRLVPIGGSPAFLR